MKAASEKVIDENSRLRANLIGLQTIVIKEVTRLLRIWPQTIVPPVITTTLYYIIFGKVIGSRVGEMGGVSYMEFIVPGLVMMSVINNSYSNVVSSFFSSKFQRNVEEMLISPMHNSVILLGFMAGGIVRAMMIGTIVLLVSMFFVETISIYSIPVTFTVALLTASLFSIGGFINALLARKFDDVAIIPTFVLTPLIYLGGVFYAIALLPEPWQTISRFNPIVYMVSAFRYGILKDQLNPAVIDINIGVAFGIIVVFIIALFSLALWMLNRGTGLRA
ncbi:MAG: ABC-2 type transport system permease protein [Mariniblastus sp.]|jgi:ABC-2 type transport system permease protein